jgi:hypothetical protein
MQRRDHGRLLTDDRLRLERRRLTCRQLDPRDVGRLQRNRDVDKDSSAESQVSQCLLVRLIGNADEDDFASVDRPLIVTALYAKLHCARSTPRLVARADPDLVASALPAERQTATFTAGPSNEPDAHSTS